MKRIDFENGTVTNNILSTALPMLVAQILNLLYNIVDRIYIARIQDVGTTALGAVGFAFRSLWSSQPSAISLAREVHQFSLSTAEKEIPGLLT